MDPSRRVSSPCPSGVPLAAHAINLNMFQLDSFALTMSATMAEHPNVQRIRDSYSALDAGDLSAAFQYLAPAGVIHYNRRGHASRETHGEGKNLTSPGERLHPNGAAAEVPHPPHFCGGPPGGVFAP